MKTSAQTSFLQYSLYSERWILLTSFLGILLLFPIKGHSQESYPIQSNPHGDMEQPMLPPPGIIGVALHLTAERIGDPAGLFIRATHPAGPGARAGLAHGQEILAVDGQPVKGKTYREVVAIIRGEIGKSVTLTVRTFSNVKEVKIIRVSEDMLSEEKHT
ncbi:PDZ domain-containing protein [Candidatus Nitronereus thalassa]|uniref:PDZ domain-containing protein n=1 Tax=Candidatus Nitronereus thalassa TaxID=3020898 RepID=A0ABU3K873_9BACT|nr:PDZ domain-containing protein [Candidatus Nitronereus thalassa]MDT7042518.1 PDZ domain-containing protein [Candidatus Nitronereus thalassa]